MLRGHCLRKRIKPIDEIGNGQLNTRFFSIYAEPHPCFNNGMRLFFCGILQVNNEEKENCFNGRSHGFFEELTKNL